MYICIHVYMYYVCIYVCMCVCMHACTDSVVLFDPVSSRGLPCWDPIHSRPAAVVARANFATPWKQSWGAGLRFQTAHHCTSLSVFVARRTYQLHMNMHACIMFVGHLHFVTSSTYIKLRYMTLPTLPYLPGTTRPDPTLPDPAVPYHTRPYQTVSCQRLGV